MSENGDIGHGFVVGVVASAVTLIGLFTFIGKPISKRTHDTIMRLEKRNIHIAVDKNADLWLWNEELKISVLIEYRDMYRLDGAK